MILIGEVEFMRCKGHDFLILIIVTVIVFQTINAQAYSEYASPLKIYIGNDPEGHDVYLNKYSVVDVNKRIKRATHFIIIDDTTEEYIADYNCSQKTLQMLKLTIKEDNKTIEQKDLNTNAKITGNSIYSKLLEAVCRQNNSTPSHRRK